MKREFVLLLALCAFAAAMVPRRRRAVDTETQDPMTTTNTPRICAPNTPCRWDFYHEYSRAITKIVVNTYCECEKGMDCLLHEDDALALAYVKRCKVPSADSEASET